MRKNLKISQALQTALAVSTGLENLFLFILRNYLHPICRISAIYIKSNFLMIGLGKCAHVCLCVFGGVRKTSGNPFSSSTMWVPSVSPNNTASCINASSRCMLMHTKWGGIFLLFTCQFYLFTREGTLWHLKSKHHPHHCTLQALISLSFPIP